MEFWTCGWNELSFWWSSRNFWILSYAASRGLASQFSALSLSWCRRWCAHLLTPVGLTQVADSGGFSPQKLLGQSGDHGFFGWVVAVSTIFFYFFFPVFFLKFGGNDEIHLRLANIFFQLAGTIPPPKIFGTYKRIGDPEAFGTDAASMSCSFKQWVTQFLAGDLVPFLHRIMVQWKS